LWSTRARRPRGNAFPWVEKMDTKELLNRKKKNDKENERVEPVF